MKLKLKNFGIVKSIDVDLSKDLHLIHGPKTYTMRATYLITKHFIEQGKFFRDYFFYLMEARGKYLTSLLRDLKGTKVATEECPLLINDFLGRIVKEAFEQVFLPNLKESFDNTFSSELQNQRSKEDLEIIFKTGILTLSIKERKDKHWYAHSLELHKDFAILFDSSERELSQKENITHLYVDQSSPVIEKLSEEVLSLSLAIIQRFFESVTKSIGAVYYLPASRTGLYQVQHAFSRIFEQLGQMRQLTDIPFAIPALPEPIADYFVLMSSIQSHNYSDKISDLANQIERQIFEGFILQNTHTKHLEYFSKRLNLRLKLSDASNAISELAPLVALLKYKVCKAQDFEQLRLFETQAGGAEDLTQKQSILFVEEPDAHLHTDSQQILVEIFAKLIDNDLQLFLSSTSETLITHLQSLCAKDLTLDSNTKMYPLKMTSIGSIVHLPHPEPASFDDQPYDDQSAHLMDLINESLPSSS